MRKQPVPVLAKNLSRFRLRTWFAFTALWLGLCAVATVGSWPIPSTAAEWATPGPTLELRPEQQAPLTRFEKEMAAYAQEIRSHLSKMALFTAIPPVALLLSGWMLLWFARASRPE